MADDSSGAQFRARLSTGEVRVARSGTVLQNGRLRMQFEGASRLSSLTGLEPDPGVRHYFHGNDPTQWRSQMPGWLQLRQDSVYPGIDVVYRAPRGEFEYDVIVAPGADPSRIVLGYQGARSIGVESGGDLLLSTADGVVRQRLPEAYQLIKERKVPVSAAYRVRGRRVTFNLGTYNHKHPLVIDPVMVYATYLGGEFRDAAWAVAADKEGNAYVTGFTRSPGFPASTGAYKATCGTDGFCNESPSGYADIGRPHAGAARDGDAFVAKISADGKNLLWATFLGGASGEAGGSIAVDGQGNVYVAGWTESADFPVKTPIFGAVRAPATFFVKLDSSGGKLLFSTLVPGLTDAIAGADGAGRGYLGGTAGGTPPLPTTAGAVQRSGAGAYLASVNAAGDTIAFGTYLGGTGTTTLNGMQVAPDGSVALAGTTNSTNLPTSSGVFQSRIAGDFDAFAARFDGSGQLLFCTYLGGSQSDSAVGVAADGQGNVYVAGVAASADFPVVGGLPASFNSMGFATKISSDGRHLIYSTHLRTQPNGATGGPDGAFIVATSQTFSTDVKQIDPTGTALSASLTVPVKAELPLGLATDSVGNVYLAALAFATPTIESGNYFLATPGAYQTVSGGFVNASLTKISLKGGSIQVTPASLDLQTSVQSDVDVGLTVGTTGSPFAAPVDITARADVPWLSTAEGNASTLIPARIKVTAGLSSGAPLTPGVYTGNIILESPGAENSPLTLPVRLSVYDYSTPYVYAYPPALHCNYNIGTDARDDSADHTNVGLTIGGVSLSGVAVTSISSGWLSYDPIQGSVKCDPTGLAPGLYLGEVDAVTDAETGRKSLKVAVDFLVSGQGVTARPGSITFYRLPGEAPTTAEAILTTAEAAYGIVRPVPLKAVSNSAPWVTVHLQSDTLPTTLLFEADARGLAPGLYHDTVRVSVPDAANPEVSIPITLNIASNVPITVSPEAIAYRVPSQEMLPEKTILVDSPTPVSFTAALVASSNVHLEVTPTSGVTPAVLHIKASGLEPYNDVSEDNIAITSGGFTRVIPISVSNLTYHEVYDEKGIVNAAAFANAPVAPGSLISIFGSNLSLTVDQAKATPLPSSLAGVTVYVNQKVAPAYYVSPTQINVQLPADLSPGPAKLTVQGRRFAVIYDVPLTIAASAPGIFTWGQNQAAALNADHSVNSPDHPASPGSTVSLYCTGQGAVDHPVATGASAPVDSLVRTILPVTATVGGVSSEVSFSGLAPGLVGACQVNLVVPKLAPGAYPVAIQTGTAESNAPILSVGP